MPWPAPTDFVHGEPLPPPGTWTRPGLLMFFNLECPACVSRGVPFMKRLHRQYGEHMHFLAVHTSRGHRLLPREDVVPTLEQFAASFAKLPFPVALDLNGELAYEADTEGTPHWLVLAPGGAALRSIYGSQENAQTRLEYLLDELAGGPEVGRPLE